MRRPTSSALPLLLALALAACASEAPPPKPPAPPPPPAPVAAPAPPAVPPGHLLRADVDQVLTTQGPPWLLRRILSEEVMKTDGKFAGWRMVGLPEEWRNIDLRPGDVVTRVNGLPLETPDQFFEAWKSVAKAPEIKIALIRDGASRELTIPIDGAPTPETTTLLGRDPGPQRSNAPAQHGSIQLGGNAPPDTPDDEAY